MKLAIIGTGYVGLVSGTCFAEFGLEVVCVDKDERKISNLIGGKIPIFEPDLEELVAKNTEEGRLSFSTNLTEAVKGVDAVFIAVGTPDTGEEGGADLSYVFAVAKELSKSLEDGVLVVTKSTVPVGTGAQVREIIVANNPNLTFEIVSNPEFLREGCAVEDFLKPDRVIVGAESEYARNKMAAIYKPLQDARIPLLFTDIKTSELTKYAANAFLATKISFINEIASLCEEIGGNIEDIARGMGMDHRIGEAYLKVGPGFGGSCFPKDTLAIKKMARDAGAATKVVEAVIKSNDERKIAMAQKVIAACGGSVSGKIIAILGLAFKANTDDMRYSASTVIIEELLKAGAKIRAFDPEAMEEAKAILKGDIRWCQDGYDAMNGADAASIVTEWEDFANLNLDKVRNLLKTPAIIDFRNLYKRSLMESKGIKYFSIGRKVIG